MKTRTEHIAISEQVLTNSCHFAQYICLKQHFQFWQSSIQNCIHSITCAW